MDILLSEPLSARAGDTWNWRREDLSSDYPASEWTLKYYLLKSDKQIIITATADGDNFDIAVTKTVSAAYTAGTYAWIAKVSKGAGATEEAHVVANGQMEILPDLAAATTGHDFRSFNKRMLDVIRTLLEGRVPKDVNEYSFENRRVIRMTPTELMDLEKIFSRRVRIENAKERRKRGAKDGFSAGVGFSS